MHPSFVCSHDATLASGAPFRNTRSGSAPPRSTSVHGSSTHFGGCTSSRFGKTPSDGKSGSFDSTPSGGGGDGRGFSGGRSGIFFTPGGTTSPCSSFAGGGFCGFEASADVDAPASFSSADALGASFGGAGFGRDGGVGQVSLLCGIGRSLALVGDA
ncbi:hypothetical protein [Polyangium sp. 6x1]|uniref:hypothetical protein n=1 Tax=Polyangium sp. 6x1 TaxID=3042689 RepID=UPI00248328B6|nr:hypothetical protein [Polyangium sp. 6x1]MDI1447851.1 hypothetical protein [Polyangium sp. 6x1]